LPSRTKSAKPAPASAPTVVTPDPNRIFLIDTMSFIFRAYHAMARQRSMSTKSGLPTAAVYVFVNMLRKLRDDFSPNYLAAVFDVAAKTFRDTQAEAITRIQGQSRGDAAGSGAAVAVRAPSAGGVSDSDSGSAGF
jgi:hypothetical protein